MYQKIISNTLAQIISKILTALISIVLIGILTKYLPIELYGSYNKIYSYLGIFAFLADLGLYTIAIREISEGKTDPKKVIWNILSLRTVLWVGIIVIAVLLAMILPWYGDTLTLIAIAIVGIFTLISLINSSLLALMQSQMKMEFSLFSVIFGKIITLWLIAFWLMIWFHFPEQASVAFIFVFIAGLIWVLSNTILNYVYTRTLFPITYQWDKEYIVYLLKISLPYGIALFLSVVYFKVDIILISILESPQQSDISIALYGLPMKIIEVLMVLWGFYLNSILPTLTQKFETKTYKDIVKLFWVSLKILASFGILVCLLGNLFAVETIRTISTPEYIHPTGSPYNSVEAFRIGLWVLLFHFLALANTYILIASKKQSILLKVHLVVAIVNIIGNIILIPKYSFIGAAIVTLLSQILLMSITWYIVSWDVHIPWKYVSSIITSIILAILLYIIFTPIIGNVSLGDVWKILLFAPIITMIYMAAEYISSKKILT